jgi:UDP-N-acetylmuramoyl-L-alanyl-D-glutamate--2,6-diaminopimelate ligase
MLPGMRLADLAAGVPGAVVEAGAGYEVRSVQYDSRQAGPGDLFVAITGLRSDGHDFAAAAAAHGAAICFTRPLPLAADAPRVRVSDTRTALAELAATLLGRPARRLRVAGVTGTDGKTTTTHIAGHVLEHAGRRAGSMSTVAFRLGADETHNQSGQTTTEAPDVQAWLARMVEGGVAYAVIEATSHALVQQRVGACDFDVAAVTNVGIDHLDYHRTWDDYLEAKARLIDLAAAAAPKGLLKTAILNRDDVSWERLSQRPIERRWSYSIDNEADIRAVDTWGDANGSRYRLLTPVGDAEVELRLPARFNVYNALCAAGICLAFGLSVDEVAAGLSTFRGVAGRLEPIEMGQDFKVFIDFAHSAGALASALRELRPFASGRLIVVFGSTARSDHDRPGMGRAAAEGADYFLITTDDPLDEDPFAIAADVQAGVVGKRAPGDYAIVLDRRRAIRDAIAMARPGDVVLLAGKGHERTMLTAAGKEPWDERAEAEAAIRATLRP